MQIDIINFLCKCILVYSVIKPLGNEWLYCLLLLYSAEGNRFKYLKTCYIDFVFANLTAPYTIHIIPIIVMPSDKPKDTPLKNC